MSLSVDAAAIELVRKREIGRVMQALAGEDILFFKGTALAYSLYPQPHLRPRLDHDILVRAERAADIHAALLALGYKLHVQLEIFNEKCFFREDDWGVQHVWDVHSKINNRAAAADLFSFEELWLRS